MRSFRSMASAWRIERRYDVSGRVEWLRSYDASDTVVNDVMFYYNSWGQVYYDCQAHAGGASAGSPRIVYYYGDGSAGHIRPTMMANIVGGMTLRRLLFYDYNAGADDAFNRVSFLADEGSPNTPGQHLGRNMRIWVEAQSCRPAIHSRA